MLKIRLKAYAFDTADCGSTPATGDEKHELYQASVDADDACRFHHAGTSSGHVVDAQNYSALPRPMPRPDTDPGR